jgi:hypothetical protein
MRWHELLTKHMEQQPESSATLVPVVTTASGPTEEEIPLNVSSMAPSSLHDNLEEGAAVGSKDEMDSSDMIANVVIAPSASDDDVKSEDKDIEEGFLESNDEMDVKSEDKDPEEGVVLESNEEMDLSDVCSLSVAGGITLRSELLPFSSWSRERIRYTALGLLSSSIVLMIRLVLDKEPTAYVIHSIIVFFDMILIHLFTNSPWLSVSGELVTVIFFLAFHFTTETVFELFETTFIAALCSFHLIASRNKHMDREGELEVGIENIRLHTLAMLGTAGDIDHLDTTGIRLLENEEGMTSASADATFRSWVIAPEDPNKSHRRLVKGCGKHFFEHFLDGSAGVMYTSFFGLIIDELITYGQGGK